MTQPELIVVAAVAPLQLLTVWLWLAARADAHAYRESCQYLNREYADLWRNSIRRNARTGRYMKRGN